MTIARARHPARHTVRGIAFAAGAVLAALATPTAARAQFGGVLPPPPAPPVVFHGEADATAAKPTARDTADLRQRLDIQAWVDSAAGALARTPPANRPVPPPTGEERPRPATPPVVSAPRAGYDRGWISPPRPMPLVPTPSRRRFA